MELESRAKKIKHGFELIEWDIINSTDDVTRSLIGSNHYWKAPEFEGMFCRDVEIKILKDTPRSTWGYAQPYGKPIWQHILTLGKILTPSKDILPSVYDVAQAMCINFSFGGKAVNMIGAQSMGKTDVSCAIPAWLSVLYPKEFLCFIACPTNNVADTGAWGAMVSLMGEMIECHPDLFPHYNITKSKEIILEDSKYTKSYNKFKFGRFMVRKIDDMGKFRGIKEDNINTGFIFIVADEISEFENWSYVDMWSNIISNEGFQSFTSHNWKNDTNIGAFVCKPDSRYGGIGAYEELDIDKDQCWDSWGKSITIRLDGMKSLNILTGKTLTKYNYFRQGKLDDLLEIFGADDPEFLSQARAFPSTGDSARTVLTKRKVDKSDWQREFWTPIEKPRKDSFVDPSFGGGDDCVWGCICTGKCAYTDANGDRVEEELVWMDAPMRKIKLTKGATYVNSTGDEPEYWKNKIIEAGIPTSLFHEEDEHGNPTIIDYDEQIVIQCALLNKEHGVSNSNMAYDSSLRPTIVDSMTRLLGSPRDGGPRYIDYNTKPLNYWSEAYRQNTEDFCINHLDELAFLTAGLFQNRRIRGGQFMTRAVEELCITRWESKTNNKKKVERKSELKSRNKGKSPDHRDCLMGLVGQVYFGGFGKKPSATNSLVKKGVNSYWLDVNRNHRYKFGIGLDEI